jgi:mannose-6-phosphate isomerase-like protein (cupin superfamily)
VSLSAVETERVEKPWGYELVWARTDRYVGKILHVRRDHALSLQYHRVKEETIRLLSGRMRLETETAGGEREVRILEPGEGAHVRPGLRHRMEALEDCEVLEVSTPELDDVVRLADRYGRADPSSHGR